VFVLKLLTLVKYFKIVYASSSSVYGNTTKIPIKEDFPRNPINPYGQTKLEGEVLAKKYSEDGVSVICLRYFNVYGKGQTGTYAGVITQFLNKLKEKKQPVIYGDGTQIRDFIFVEDVAKANLAAMESNVKSDFLNVGTGNVTSIKDLAEIMINLFGLEFKPIFSDPLEGDVKNSQADISYTESKIKWKYQTELKDGLKKMVLENCRNEK